MRPPRPIARAGVAGIAGIVLIVGLAACGPASSASPAPSAVLGIDWGRAASVERPLNYEGTLPPSDNPTHPILRIPGQAYMEDVTALPGGGYAAIGYVPPAWTPAAWTSPDGQAWAFHSIGDTGFTFPVAMAVGNGGTIVAVGRSGSKPLAWTSSDGATWRSHPVATLGSAGIAERMTSVVAAPSGFLAGGSVGPELSDRHARFWTSSDGATWQPVPDDAAAFANAEVRAIASFAGGYVAVGVVGSVQAPTGAVAWTSSDGVTWRRVDDPSFKGGIAVAITAAPFGGLVAVGSNLDRTEAVAWVSPEGRSWTKAPGEASRRYDGYTWMTDIVAAAGEVLAVGEYQGLQRGTATAWISSDGLHWQQARAAPVQEQGEIYAVTSGGPGVIAVGSFGAPDSYVPSVWLSPAR